MKTSIINFSVFLLIGMINFNGLGQIDQSYDLPELLISNEGVNIQNEVQWNNIRRLEILELYKNFVYGRILDNNISVSFKLKKLNVNALKGRAIQKEVIVTFTNGIETLDMNMLIFLPKKSVKPVPVFLGMNFYGNQTIHLDSSITITPNYVRNSTKFLISNNKATEKTRGVRAERWPVEHILERGYGLATIYYGDLDPDFDDGFQNGIHKLFYKDGVKPKADEMGSISAWAYGLIKAMDYLETDKDIDKKKVVVMGHSRLGKTALWAGALDQRFAIAISNDSGCGGAALFRRNHGESIKSINKHFPHWFCRNFHQFDDKEEQLPIDQHMLISLIAPRPVYVASAVEDKWADPKGEYLSLFYAGEVYSLFGQESFKSKELPEIDRSRMTGNMGYHIRSGTHNLTLFDWERYMDFADQFFKNH